MSTVTPKKPKTPLAQKIRRMFGSRFRAGSYALFASVIIIAIAVVVNMAVGSLPSTSTQFDLSENSLYDLSDQTKRICASLNSDVELYLLAITGNEDSTIQRLLDRYADLSSHIHATAVDPTVEPTFLEPYDISLNQLYANSVLVVCGSRSRVVSYTDIYVTSYSMDYSTYNYTSTTTFDGENALTNAIHYVSSENLPKAYVLTGHGEEELSDTLQEMLEQDNFETESLSLMTLEAVPEDATLVIINTPSSDLNEDEANMLITFLEGGGGITLTTDYINEGEMPNLLKVTASMGLTVQNGLVIESDSGRYYPRYPHYLLPNIESHDITDALISGNYYILTPLAQGLVQTGDTGANVTFLLTTSDNAYGKTAGLNATTTAQEDGDVSGPFNIAAVSELGDGKLFWIACSGFMSEQIDNAVSGANSNLYLNAVNWMSDQEESISIRSKSLETEGLTVSQGASSFWSVVMIGIIPAALIAFGILITIRRKRR